MSARGLETLFATHEARWTTHGWERTYQVMHCAGDCDWRLRQKALMSDDHCYELHRAHVAAEVRAWLAEVLAGEGLREAVARVVSPDAAHPEDRQIAADFATAALTTVCEHLTNTGRVGSEEGR